MTHPHHHPDAELLLAYAGGALDEARALAVATHMALCPACRGEVRHMEAVGGALMEGLAPAALSGDALDQVLSRLDEPAPPAPKKAAGGDPGLPEPLRSYIGQRLDGLSWKQVIKGAREFRLDVGRTGASVYLLHVEAGRAMPAHTHDGEEITLVLKGAYHDGIGHYKAGDFDFCDGEIDHQPKVDKDGDCICLIVNSAPIRLTGTFTRLLNPLLSRG